jgi:acyl dehydratase
LDSVIAHGMLSMAFLGQFITSLIADMPDAYLRQLHVRFASMVHLGDTITCLGTVQGRSPATSDGYEEVSIECWAQSQRGEKVTLGEAIVALSRSTTEGTNV